MPRNKRFNLRGVTQLVIQNAPPGKPVMECRRDFQMMLRAMQMAAEYSDTDVHGYSFGPEQIVMLLTPNRERGVSILMQSLGKRYIVYRAGQGHDTPRLWAGRHRVVPVENGKFFLVTSHLVERVHIAAGEEPDTMLPERSSYSENSGAVPLRVLTPHPLYLSLGESQYQRSGVYRQQSESNDWQRYMAKIHDVLAGRGYLATTSYIQTLEAASGTRLIPGKPGRPPARRCHHGLSARWYSG